MPNPTSHLSAVVASLLLAGLVQAQTAQPQGRILGDVDEATMVTLPGNVHPLALSNPSKEADGGTLMEHMILYLKGDASQEAQLAQLVAEQNDPKSALHGHFLTPQEFAAQFGAAKSDIEKVTAWLESHGFTVEESPAGNRAVVFSGTASQVADAFKTEIRQYSIAGKTHYANASDPQIAAALAGVVGGIVKLHNFPHSANISKSTAVTSAQLANPQYTSGSSHYLVPADYGIIYDINPLYSAGINGTGQSIAVIARSNISLTDVESFRSNFGLPAHNPQIVIVNNDPGILEGDSTETTLDTEWSGAVASNATIKVIVAASTNSADGIDLAALYAVNNNVAPIITLSYGSCEADMGGSELSFYNSLWQQAAAEGISVMVAAGDAGAAGCYSGSATSASSKGINGLCSSPYSTCVGGSEFNEGSNPGQYWLAGNNALYGSATGYIPEEVWNESGSNGGSGLWAGGGGVSTAYTKPVWQTGPGVPADGQRDVPDVSLTASGHDGYLIVQSGSFYSVGGTSAATPSFAGIMAMVEQKSGARQGLANTILYPLAANQTSGGAAVFHDITTGNNSVPGVTGYTAAKGYDLASGLGSVDANVLVNNWTSASATPTLSVGDSPGTLTVDLGKTSQTTITTVASSLKSAVTLTVTGLPTGVTAALSSATVASPGSGSVALTIAATSAAKTGTYSLTITAAGGGKTATTTLSVSIVAPTFTLTTGSTSVTVDTGSTAKVAIATTPENGFSSAVALSVSGLPTGVTAAFSPASVGGAAAGASTLTLTAASTAKNGSYTLTISATGGGVTVGAALSVSIVTPTFTLTASSTSVAAIVGCTAKVAIATVPQNGFNAALALAVSGLPSGVTAAFSPASIGGTGAGVSALTLTVASTAKSGSYPLTISATGGGVTQTAAVTLTLSLPASCTLTANPTSVNLSAGQSTSVAVSCGSVLGAFSAPLSFSLTGMPSGLTVSAPSVSFAAGSSITLTLNSTLSVAAGTFNFSLTASSGSFSQTLSIPVVISASSFRLTAAQSSVTVAPGTTGQVSVTNTHSGAFNSAVNLTVTGLPAGVTASLSKSTLAAPGDGTVALGFTVAASATSGTYSVTVTGTGGGQTETVPVTLIVAPAKNFSFGVNVPSMTIQQSGPASTMIISTGNFTGGFDSTITVSFSGLAPGMNFSVVGSSTGNNLVNISLGWTAASSTPVGTYPILATATGAGITHTVTVQVTVTKATVQTVK
jgi:subtilase family serine protease